MRIELTEVLWLEEHEVMTETELIEASGLSEAEFEELMECGVLAPEASSAEPRTFAARSVTVARTARRLRKDFGLSADGLALAMTLLQRIRDLETQVERLRAQLPGRTG